MHLKDCSLSLSKLGQYYIVMERTWYDLPERWRSSRAYSRDISYKFLLFNLFLKTNQVYLVLSNDPNAVYAFYNIVDKHSLYPLA